MVLDEFRLVDEGRILLELFSDFGMAV